MTDERDETPCYIARIVKPTKHDPIVGTVVCAAVDDGKRLAETAIGVAKWAKAGLLIERAPVWWVRKHLFSAEPLPKAGEPAQ